MRRFFIIAIGLVLFTACQNQSTRSQNDQKVWHLSDNGYRYIMLDSQVVDIEVTDPNLYEKNVSSTGEELLLGSDLFFWLCSDCHAPNKIIDTTDFYDEHFDLIKILSTKSENHGDWSKSILSGIDSNDITAIQYFIDRYKRNGPI